MKTMTQFAQLSLFAAAIVALAACQSGGNEAGNAQSQNVVAANPSVERSAATSASSKGSFDPMASRTEAVQSRPKTAISFANYEHDFGTIQQDSHNHYQFSFTNTGTEPLILENATGSCGCTVPNYPKQPIPPGGTGTIEIEYKPGKQQNAQTKTVTVVANTEPKETTLRIKAFVQPS
ncbi:MAG: DUF1573 domain-containing protein [Flavobacteriales bacterium]|jgi:hypothetical protein|nr:DUF1573 domain-containing protein [Flavobacteriales bacterium]